MHKYGHDRDRMIHRGCYLNATTLNEEEMEDDAADDALGASTVYKAGRQATTPPPQWTYGHI